MTLPAVGRYRVWVRYLDIMRHRARTGFAVTARAGRAAVGAREMGTEEESPRANTEGERKWGPGYSRWMWRAAEFDAAAGPLRLSVEKLHNVPVTAYTRSLDMLIVTTNLTYEPPRPTLRRST